MEPQSDYDAACSADIDGLLLSSVEGEAPEWKRVPKGDYNRLTTQNRAIKEENAHLRKENSHKDDLIRNLSMELHLCGKSIKDFKPRLMEKKRRIEEQDVRLQQLCESTARLQQTVITLLIAMLNQLCTHSIAQYLKLPYLDMS